MDSRLEKILALSMSAVFALATTNTAGYITSEASKQNNQKEERVSPIFDKNIFDYSYSLFFGIGEYAQEKLNNPQLNYPHF